LDPCSEAHRRPPVAPALQAALIEHQRRVAKAVFDGDYPVHEYRPLLDLLGPDSVTLDDFKHMSALVRGEQEESTKLGGQAACVRACGAVHPPPRGARSRAPTRPLQVATRDFTLSELAAPVGDDTHQFFLIPVADLMNHNDSPNVERTGVPAQPAQGPPHPSTPPRRAPLQRFQGIA
jgi:hypothetical protein